MFAFKVFEHNYSFPRRRIVPVGVRRAGGRTRRRRLNKLSCAGWVPHDRGFVSGLPHSRDEHRSGDRLITALEDSPPWPCLRQCAPSGATQSLPSFLGFVAQRSQVSAGWALRAIAQMKPTISRAIAVVITTFGLPAAARRRYRAHSRTCAFHAMSRMAAGSGSRRS